MIQWIVLITDRTWTNILNNKKKWFQILYTLEFQRSSESSTVVSKRNSVDAYCNVNGRATSENGGISLMHHPRSLSPLPHQRSQVLFSFSNLWLFLLSYNILLHLLHNIFIWFKLQISPSELQLLQPGDEVLWSVNF